MSELISYLDSNEPIDMHCHGIGKFDFVEPAEIVLDKIEEQLKIEEVKSIITLYIPQSKLNDLEIFAQKFHEGVKENRYPHILGFALEGPLLASFGGTPEQGCWVPNKDEWSQLAKLGSKGLVYVVLSPDAKISQGLDENFPENMEWIIDLLYQNSVRPALGHYKKNNPKFAAEQTEKIISYVRKHKLPPLFTDHLFNDMPINFKNSWRSESCKKKRDLEIKELKLNTWNKDLLEEKLGLVPAAIIRGAWTGDVKICMNFDGEHVDLEICKKAVEIIGSNHIMLMTDRIQSEILAGQKLTQKDNTSLLYQKDGIVAGGTLSVSRQILKMIAAGLENSDIINIVSKTPSEAMGLL